MAASTSAPAAPQQSSTLTTISSLRNTLCNEATPLTDRFRALFSLKHLARTNPAASTEARAAIDAIAAGFASPSALLKHELAYCLGQTGNEYALAPLTAVLEDVHEDAMCRHEAAEALGALGKTQSLDVLRRFRDRPGEEVVVTETCEIAIDRIEWENGEGRKVEKLRQRYVLAFLLLLLLGKGLTKLCDCLYAVISTRSIRHRLCLRTRRSRMWKSWAEP
jgi:deoxyhypusine monooxygenase